MRKLSLDNNPYHYYLDRPPIACYLSRMMAGELPIEGSISDIMANLAPVAFGPLPQFIQDVRAKYGLQTPTASNPDRKAPETHPHWEEICDDCARFLPDVFLSQPSETNPVSPIPFAQAFAELANFVANALISEWAKTLATHIICNFPLDVFSQAMAQVVVIPLPDHPKALVYANALDGADPSATADEFRAKCAQAFGYESFRISTNPDWDITFLTERAQNHTYGEIYQKHRSQILDWYRKSRPDLFGPELDGSRYQAETLEHLAIDMIKARVKNAKARFRNVSE